MKVCVVGAGWYGCHITRILSSLNFNVTLLDKKSDLLACASGANQNRLHLGFHYPRNHRTRIQSLIGYNRFREEYAGIVSEISNNIYAVPNLESLMDYSTYCGIMASTGVPYRTCKTPSILHNIEGSISTDEMLINASSARIYFRNKLQSSLKLNTEVNSIKSNENHVLVNYEKYDYLIDCTWGHLIPNDDAYFEASLLLKMKKKKDFDMAITLVDGDLWSLYPTNNNDIYTLSSVVHTPLFSSKSSKEINRGISVLSEAKLSERKDQIITHALQHFPSLLEYFEFSDYQISIKTKLSGLSSDRSCYVKKTQRVISIQSGKIDNIFYASDFVIKLLTNEN